MKIDVFNRQKDLSLDKSSARALVQEILSFLDVKAEQASIYFVDVLKISALHDQFFQDPTPTDCISFPIDEQHLGEIFVCPKVAITYAMKRDLDPYQETTLYVVHGILHLLGFDDLEPKARRTMRKKEKSCMRHLKEQKVFLKPK